MRATRKPKVTKSHLINVGHLAPLLGGRFGYFLFFSAWGGGRGSPRRRRGGGRFLLKFPGAGGGFSPGGEGFEGPGRCLR